MSECVCVFVCESVRKCVCVCVYVCMCLRERDGPDGSHISVSPAGRLC